jgi:hypothetical protein
VRHETRNVAWFFHVVELDDGRWACRHGSLEYDTHAALNDAIEHITTVSASHRPAEMFLHRLDGTVEKLGAV